jgi:ADP-ribosyl-[dinitrogen reductase] hydrolase
MKGAIVGDIVGSRFEFNNIKSKDFELFTPECSFTDDTITTIATMDWLMTPGGSYSEILRHWCNKYPHPMGGYGGRFAQWLHRPISGPYNSFGNGSAMRVSPVGFFFSDLLETVAHAEISAEITHNHPEGIIGAISTAQAIYMLRNGATKDSTKELFEEYFGYIIPVSCRHIRKDYGFNETCQGTIPQAVTAFLESITFEDSIRNAISVGGDSDTLACINGGLAEAHYGVPSDIWDLASRFIPTEMLTIIDKFYGRL